MALAAVLGVAAASKLRSPRSAAAGLATFGIAAPMRLPAAFTLVAVEAALAVGVAVGSDGASYGAAALVAVFALAVGSALARGARGAPCVCFGARSRVGSASLARNVGLAATLAVLPSLPRGMPSTEGWLLIAIAGAFVCIALLTIAVLALAREVGILRLRVGTESALDVSEEGPPVGSRVDPSEWFDIDSSARLAVAVFSSDGCRLCQSLKPVVAAFRRDPLLAVQVFDEERDADVWRELRIPGSPFAVAIDRGGAVHAKGTFNTYAQLESILATAERRLAEAHA
jgi:hypothetical protein